MGSDMAPPVQGMAAILERIRGFIAWQPPSAIRASTKHDINDLKYGESGREAVIALRPARS